MTTRGYGKLTDDMTVIWDGLHDMVDWSDTQALKGGQWRLLHLQEHLVTL